MDNKKQDYTAVNKQKESPAKPGILSACLSILPLHVDQRFKHFIESGNDHLGVGLETALGDNHVSELVGTQFYVALHLLE